jgi:oxygen-independent coproporphyrinogen-3 oxidase
MIEQIHWGGGSPNFLKPDEMQMLHAECLQSFGGLAPDADVSVEIDPRTTSEAHLEKLAQLGFNRVSLGVQDFDPAVQRLVNRIQPFELTERIVRTARDVGFSGVNIDLIYGLPLQTAEGFSRTVDKVLELRPERVALYGYAHVTWIKKVQKALERAHLPTPAERIEIFLAAIRRFADAGYRHIGMDHFALPSDSLSQALDTGRLNRNFMGYSTHRGARLIGMGVSAISSLPSCYAQNVKDLTVYQERITSGLLATERGLLRTVEDQLRGEVIEAILCQGRLDIPTFDARWGCRFMQKFADGLEVSGAHRAGGGFCS